MKHFSRIIMGMTQGLNVPGIWKCISSRVRLIVERLRGWQSSTDISKVQLTSTIPFRLLG